MSDGPWLGSRFTIHTAFAPTRSLALLLDSTRASDRVTLPRVPHRPPHDPTTSTKLAKKHFTTTPSSTIIKEIKYNQRPIPRNYGITLCDDLRCFLGKGKCMRYAFIQPNTCTVAQRQSRHRFDMAIVTENILLYRFAIVVAARGATQCFRTFRFGMSLFGIYKIENVKKRRKIEI